MKYKIFDKTKETKSDYYGDYISRKVIEVRFLDDYHQGNIANSLVEWSHLIDFLSIGGYSTEKLDSKEVFNGHVLENFDVYVPLTEDNIYYKNSKFPKGLPRCRPKKEFLNFFKKLKS